MLSIWRPAEGGTEATKGTKKQQQKERESTGAQRNSNNKKGSPQTVTKRKGVHNPGQLQTKEPKEGKQETKKIPQLRKSKTSRREGINMIFFALQTDHKYDCKQHWLTQKINSSTECECYLAAAKREAHSVSR